MAARSNGVVNTVAAALALSAGASAQTVVPVQFEGDPGPFPGTTASTQAVPVVSDAGDVAFLLFYSDPMGPDPSVSTVVLGPPASFSIIASENDPAPGTGLTFNGFEFPLLNASGGIAFEGRVMGPGVDGSNRNGIWVGDAGGVELAIRNGDPAPGTLSVYTNILNVLFNNAGEIAYLGWVEGLDVISEPSGRGLWSGVPGSLSLRVRGGQQAPGLNAGFESFSEDSIRLNSAGQISFSATLFGPGIGDDDQAHCLATGSSIDIIALEGGLAPGTMTTFGPIGSVEASLNDNGSVAFFGRLDGVSSATDTGIWSGSPGNVSLLLREGDAAPGLDAFIDDFTQEVLIGDGDTVVFGAALDGPKVDSSNGFAIYAHTPADGFRVLGRLGDPIPGTPEVYSNFQDLTIGRSGRIMFTGGQASNGGRALMITDAGGEPRLVTRTNAGLDIDPDPGVEDVRIVTLISPDLEFGGEDGLPVTLNAAGTLGVRLGFSDGTQGIFLVTNDDFVECPMDFDGDGDVDLGDFGVFGAAFGSTSADPNYSSAADFDNNGLVDLGDFGVFGASFGRTDCPAM